LGGLGNVAGDDLKAARDLELPGGISTTEAPVVPFELRGVTERTAPRIFRRRASLARGRVVTPVPAQAIAGGKAKARSVL
jgi:hypothetical protein